ncbi:hypothetical protein QQ045_000847 [Rhodiola kirilowii]
MEWFSRVLNAAVAHGVVRPFIAKRRGIQVNHLLFADDLLIFTNGAKNSLQALMELIKDFWLLSGQRLNADKSIIIFPKDFPLSRKEENIRLTGFREGHLPVNYLGAPLFSWSGAY